MSSIGNIKSLVWSFLDDLDYSLEKRKELGNVKEEKEIFEWIDSKLELEDRKEIKKRIISLKREPNKSIKEQVDIDSRFFSEDLIHQIYLELNKKHQLDHKEKLATFLIACSAELPESSERCSVALKGDSSAGKDNLIKTVLSHFPRKESFMLTRGTVAALEDEAGKVKRIAFSEINKDREGANSEITEVFKQLAEGGTDVIKKDPATGYRTTKRITSEQKTLLYGTTESASDDELETRYVRIPIRGGYEKNKTVISSYLEMQSDYSKLNLVKQNKESWISKGVILLDRDFDIIVPYAKELLDVFDFGKERIKRDVKRLISLTKTISWLYQKQRTIIKDEEGKRLISEPCDFLLAIFIFGDFFELSYSGLDHREEKVLESIKKNQGKHTQEILKAKFPVDYSDWCLKHLIREDTGIQSRTTFNKYIERLTDLEQVEDWFDRDTSSKYSLVKCVLSASKTRSRCVSVKEVGRILDAYWTRISTHNKIEIKRVIIRDFEGEAPEYHNSNSKYKFISFLACTPEGNERTLIERTFSQGSTHTEIGNNANNDTPTINTINTNSADREEKTSTSNLHNLHSKFKVLLLDLLPKDKSPQGIEAIYSLLSGDLERDKFDRLISNLKEEGTIYEPKHGEVALL